MTMSRYLLQAQELLRKAHLHPSALEQRISEAITLAGYMLSEANRIETSAEKRKQRQLSRMVNDSSGKVFATRLTDQCFRSDNRWRVADQICFLTNALGIPHFLGWLQKMQLSFFSALGPTFGKYFVPIVRHFVRKETSSVILPGEPAALSHHIALRKRQGVRVNLNHLGEAILGEEEAQRRLQIYLEDLARPDVEYISVKVSTIYSQINLLGWDDTLAILSDRLKQLYRAAKDNLYVDGNGNKVPKFVNLDMEEYRDIRLTATLFTTVLDDAEFYDYSAGIVLQAYLPDAYLFQQELTAWAMQRVANGGAPIKIRLVKGANLAMEKVEASLRDWEQAPYTNKADVDANYKRMMAYGCEREHAEAVRLGIASHNLFDIAYGMLLREENGVDKWVSFEMLEGMADAIRQVVQMLSGSMVLYCPTATKEEFQYAVAYLTRRLDENTAPENFLRHLFNLKQGSPAWNEQVAFFTKACHDAATVSYAPRRKQNRLEAPKEPITVPHSPTTPTPTGPSPKTAYGPRGSLPIGQKKNFNEFLSSSMVSNASMDAIHSKKMILPFPIKRSTPTPLLINPLSMPQSLPQQKPSNNGRKAPSKVAAGSSMRRPIFCKTAAVN
jgi:RHH-type proline utilization regulon transcriptional repressor/proline dehydrogenase/delta 1-pyrroline-5-carboxylate dehydrogenase